MEFQPPDSKYGICGKKRNIWRVCRFEQCDVDRKLLYWNKRHGTQSYQDTDNDGIANYLDIDDDDDGIISINEDYNNNGNLQDDDLNANNVPDYLDAAVLGINEPIAAAFDITVFPNPVQDKVTVKGNADFQMQNIQVLSLTGQVVETKFNVSGDNTFEINTSKLSSGIYLLVIKSNDNLYSRKISKK